MLLKSLQESKMFAKLFIVLCVCALSTQKDGWASFYPNSDTFVGEIKNCTNFIDENSCYIMMWSNIGTGTVTGGYGGHYSINTYSAPGFIGDSSSLVLIPSSKDEFSGYAFVPWRSCGLAMISVSDGTPTSVMNRFDDIANKRGCDNIEIFDNTTDTSDTGKLVCSFAVLVVGLMYIF